MSKKTNVVRDQKGTEYNLTKKIGEGGQGIVCATELQNVIVKLFINKDSDQQRQWVNQLNWVLRQDLDGLHIARPCALIERPYPGYVMELMDGLEPLQATLESSFEALAECGSILKFIETGGLRRRLAILRELAGTLADLHARGLAYGDLSPANVFVSRSIEHHQVWLIDCDNLCVTERQGHGHLHTPGYGAPEVVRGESGINSLTDAWSFAVIAFELLTHNHPLKGTAVINGDPNLEERAYRGELPWVHDPQDQSNKACDGIPLEMVATTRLQSLFQDCFNAGLNNQLARPSMGEWADALEAAWAFTLKCTAEDCGSSFFWNEERQCPFCDEVLEDGILLSHSWYRPEISNDSYLDTGDRVALAVGEPLKLYLAPVGTRNYYKAPLVCTLLLDSSGFQITPEGDADLILIRLEDGKEFSITKQQRLSSNPARRRNVDAVLRLSHRDYPQLTPAWRFTW